MSLMLPSLLAQQPRCAVSILAIEDAWAIALAWRECLDSKVLLLLAPDESGGIAKSYEWIYFDVDIDVRSEVSAARAAALAWFALSCCPGYGGHENPVFWKCVFSELYGEHALDMLHYRHVGINDGHGFFDGDGHDFPRFKLKVQGPRSEPSLNVQRDEANVLLFGGHPSEQLESDDQAKLDRMLDILLPWIDQKRTTRRPVVSLMCPRYPNYFLGSPEKMVALTSHGAVKSRWSSPMFRLVELDINGSFFDKDSNKIPWLQNLLRLYDVDVSSFDWTDTSKISRDVLADVVRDVARLPGSATCARTSVYYHLEPRSLPAFASALPITTSIRSMWTNTASQSSRRQFEDTAIVWIAYALFHPDTPASSWKSLVLKHAAVFSRFQAVFQAMARGNNLRALLDNTEPTSDGYYRARLAANASVYDAQFTSLWQRLMRTAIATSDGDLEVEVCDIASSDPKMWDNWVAVVVPAYGVGWCRSADVILVRKRAPAKASLTQLRVSCASWVDAAAPNMMEPVLSLIGRQLVHLDMGTYLDFDSAAELKQALSCCPSLESLAIVHNGHLWTTGSMELVLPKLRELRLCLRRRTGELNALAAMTLPRSLHVLRVSAAGDLELYRRSIKCYPTHLVAAKCPTSVPLGERVHP